MKQRRWHWLLNQSKLRNWQYGLEIGVLYGQNIQYLLTGNPHLHIIGVDAWEPTDEYPDPEKMEEYYRAALIVERTYIDRCVLMRESSFLAHKELPDGFFDFVFIDADHSYEAVVNDVRNYEEKVKSGGWLCGHDIGRASVQTALYDTIGKQHIHEVGIDGCWYVQN